MLYTSYIGNLDNIYDVDTLFLIITRVNPNIKKYKNVSHVPEFAPSIELFKQAKYEGLSYKDYFNTYTKEIEGMTDDIAKLVEYIKKGNDVVLMCYEKDPEFCHRKILAEHIRDNNYGLFYTEKQANTVHTFHNKYRFLSNFCLTDITYKGLTYPSLENAYQASKTDSMDDKMKFVDLAPNKAKQFGRRVTMKEGFDMNKTTIMKELLTEKFKNSYLKRELLKTGDMELIEGNVWHDNFFGNCTCPKCKDIEGRNVLGRLIMEVRESIRQKENIKACMFTGHRPKYFGSYNLKDEVYKPIIEEMSSRIDMLIDKGVNTFISGSALGVDTIAFWIVEKKKINNDNIRNILCLPYRIQGDNWNKSDRELLARMKSRADEVVIVDEVKDYMIGKSGKYSSYKLQRRNEYMVDNADYMIAVWNGTPSGTKNCIDFAKENELEIEVIKV